MRSATTTTLIPIKNALQEKAPEKFRENKKSELSLQKKKHIETIEKQESEKSGKRTSIEIHFEICPEFNSLTTDFSSTMPPLEKLINTKSLFAHLIKSLLINPLVFSFKGICKLT